MVTEIDGSGIQGSVMGIGVGKEVLSMDSRRRWMMDIRLFLMMDQRSTIGARYGSSVQYQLK